MDKSILNIAGIIAFIVGIICCCTIVGVVIGIPLIIGGNKLREYSNMSNEDLKKEKENLLIWTIVMLFLCTISGVLCLVYYLSMEDVKFFSSSSNNTKYEDLEKINKLYKEKVLTKEEYEAEKERILNNK